MNEALIDSDELSPERRSLLPGRGFFIPDSVERDRRDARAADVLDDADVVIVADPDADGLGCAALIKEVHPDAVVIPTSPYDLSTGLRRVAEYAEAGVVVFVCDLVPDTIEEVITPLQSVVEIADRIEWFDHHQWNETVSTTLQELGVNLVVGDSESECSADVTLRALDYDFSSMFVELAEVTRDHDLWICDDPRSDDLADYAHWSEPEEYVRTIRRHGADLPADVRDFLLEQRVLKTDLIERAVRRVEYHDIGGVTIGVTYGRCSQNEVAEELRQNGVDASVIIKPAGSVSIRGTDSFDRCHEVAQELGGGGHPKAAGCKPSVYRDMLDYAHHWTSHGAVAKQMILNAFQTVILEES